MVEKLQDGNSQHFEFFPNGIVGIYGIIRENSVSTFPTPKLVFHSCVLTTFSRLLLTSFNLHCDVRESSTCPVTSFLFRLPNFSFLYVNICFWTSFDLYFCSAQFLSAELPRFNFFLYYKWRKLGCKETFNYGAFDSRWNLHCQFLSRIVKIKKKFSYCLVNYCTIYCCDICVSVSNECYIDYVSSPFVMYSTALPMCKVNNHRTHNYNNGTFIRAP